MSNLYVVGQPTGHSFVKVGMTTRSVFKRIGDWDTGSPFDWVVHFDLQVPVSKQELLGIEQQVHKVLAKTGYRKRLEWFTADPVAVVNAIAATLVANGVSLDDTTLHHSDTKFDHLWLQAKQDRRQLAA